MAETTAKFDNLEPGAEYIFRLVATNPAGTARGQPSRPFVTLPSTPPAPEFAYASAKSVSIKFPAQGGQITKLGIEMAVWCADPFGPKNKKKGLLTDTSKNIGIRTTGLVRNLHPGKPYVFRLVVSNRAGTSIGPPVRAVALLGPCPPLLALEKSLGARVVTARMFATLHRCFAILQPVSFGGRSWGGTKEYCPVASTAPLGVNLAPWRQPRLTLTLTTARTERVPTALVQTYQDAPKTATPATRGYITAYRFHRWPQV